MQHSHLNSLSRGAALVAALALATAGWAQTQTTQPAPVAAYPNANGTTTYVTPSGTTTVATPAASATAPAVTYTAPAAATPAAPVAVAAAPAGTTYVAPAQTTTVPTATYVAPAPATTVVTAAPTAAPISAAGRDYDHVRVSMSAATAEPTGDQQPSTSQKLIDGANWIRKELIRDIEIAHQDITIVPANARITLYGTVPSASMQAKIEGIARTAGSPNLVVSELKVR